MKHKKEDEKGAKKSNNWLIYVFVFIIVLIGGYELLLYLQNNGLIPKGTIKPINGGSAPSGGGTSSNVVRGLAAGVTAAQYTEAISNGMPSNLAAAGGKSLSSDNSLATFAEVIYDNQAFANNPKTQITGLGSTAQNFGTLQNHPSWRLWISGSGLAWWGDDAAAEFQSITSDLISEGHLYSTVLHP